MKLLLPALLVAAALSALVGQGGGVFYTPLQLWVGIPFQQAAATSLVLIVAVSLSAALVFRRARRIDWNVVFTVEPPTMLGGFAGGFVSHAVPERVLELLLGAVLVLAAPLVLGTPRLRPPLAGPSSPGGAGRSRRPAVLAVMLVVGVVTGALGIGGGVLKVPVMMLLLGIPAETAIASSAVMVGLTAAAGVAGHASVGHVVWSSAGVLAAAAVVGAQVGSRLSLALPTAQLRRVLGTVQLAVGVLVLARALP
jgi:uncharacterized membrane protein YfcA